MNLNWRSPVVCVAAVAKRVPEFNRVSERLLLRSSAAGMVADAVRSALTRRVRVDREAVQQTAQKGRLRWRALRDYRVFSCVMWEQMWEQLLD